MQVLRKKFPQFGQLHNGAFMQQVYFLSIFSNFTIALNCVKLRALINKNFRMQRNAGPNSCTPSPNLLDLLVQGRLFSYLKRSCRIRCVIFFFFGQCLDICVLFFVFVGLLCVVLYCLCNNAYVFTLVFSVKSGHLVLVIRQCLV